MRCANVPGSNAQGARSIAKVGEVGADLWEPCLRARGDVFDDEAAGPELLDDPSVLEPKAAFCPSEPGALAGARDVLAREASADDIHGSEI